MPHLPSALLLCAAALLAGPVGVAAAARAQPNPRQVVVAFKHAARDTPAPSRALRDAGLYPVRTGPGGTVVARPTGSGSRATALPRLRRSPAVAWASPAYRARAADFTDPGTTAHASRTGGWSTVQWDLTGPFGIGAPAAWATARAAGGDGGRGVVVGVLDTGVAYADRGRWRRSPDLPRQRFVRGYDFVDGDPLPDDENGHGTFVASEIAAAAGNGYGMVGVAYKARIMPIRVLDSYGEGSSYRVALGIRWAVDHGADVLNVSIELADDFGPISLTAAPDVRSALRYARRRGVTVVGAAGNAADPAIPAARFADLIIQVGGSTEHGCLASYSNSGPGMDLLAPGGGDDALVPGDPRCRPGATDGRPIAQVTFEQKAPRLFLVPDDYEGTSMAAPHVTGVVALMLAARTLGKHPSPLTVAARLRATARPLGSMRPDGSPGAGLLDAVAALAPPPAL